MRSMVEGARNERRAWGYSPFTAYRGPAPPLGEERR